MEYNTIQGSNAAFYRLEIQWKAFLSPAHTKLLQGFGGFHFIGDGFETFFSEFYLQSEKNRA